MQPLRDQRGKSHGDMDPMRRRMSSGDRLALILTAAVSLLLDTGATYTSVGQQLAGSLGIASGGSSVTLVTASRTIQAPLALLFTAGASRTASGRLPTRRIPSA